MNSSRLIVSVPGQTLRTALGAVPDGVEIIEWKMTGPAPTERIDIVVPPYMDQVSTLGLLENVNARLVQSQSIGFDGVADALPKGQVFANATTVHETSAAELTLALILAAQRGIPGFVRAADEGRWAPARHESLADRTVLLVGHGGLGQAIEQRLLPFECEVVRVARTARSDARGPIHAIDELPELLPAADIVVVAVPLDESTTHLVDRAFLGRMRDGGLLVNIARGPVADTAAILDEARSGRLRFALDVTDPEPLPNGHPLFALPNVLITPHVGGASTAMMPRMARLLRRQIERMLAGDDPDNVVIRS
ncbi:MAG: 2-hydroxyacid dehydrogenase [Microbacteriaceae bacterium]